MNDSVLIAKKRAFPNERISSFYIATLYNLQVIHHILPMLYHPASCRFHHLHDNPYTFLLIRSADNSGCIFSIKGFISWKPFVWAKAYVPAPPSTIAPVNRPDD